MKAKVTMRCGDEWSTNVIRRSFPVVGANDQEVLLDAKANQRCQISDLVGQQVRVAPNDGVPQIFAIISFDGLE
jgi:hypothetical protein